LEVYVNIKYQNKKNIFWNERNEFKMKLTYSTEQIEKLINVINKLPIDSKTEGNFGVAVLFNEIFNILNSPIENDEDKK
jgi:hypothetical protein